MHDAVSWRGSQVDAPPTFWQPPRRNSKGWQTGNQPVSEIFVSEL
jgi:hypothetical protein